MFSFHKRSLMRFSLVLSSILFSLSLVVNAKTVPIQLTPHEAHFSILKRLPIQHGGRLKPLDTFAREAVQSVTGKTKFHDMEAIEIIFSWMFYPNTWNETPVIEITGKEIKTELGLELEKKYFTLSEMYRLTQLQKLFQAVHEKQERKEKLKKLEENLERLSMQIHVIERVSSGHLLTLIPHSTGMELNWFSVAELSDPTQLKNVYPDEKSQSILKNLQTQFAALATAY